MRRGILVATAAVLTVAAVLGVLAFFNSRDDATIGEDGSSAPGQPAPEATAPELRRGNVVLRFGDPADAAALRRLAGEYGPASLAGAGQAVLVRRAPAAQGVVAEAYRRRLQARQRWFNVVVTNVPGPQFPLYLLGRRLLHLYPVVPLSLNQALGIAIMSYDGKLGFGLLGDFDAMADLEDVADDLRKAIAALSREAGVRPGRNGSRPRLRAATPARS